MAFMKRVRLDDELISQGICADRADALRTLMAGLVSSGGERLTSPGLKVTPGLPLHVKGRIPYVGRGGLKLEGALDAFDIDPTGLACLDVGCSTGGFTDCLLKRGAATVVSVDVGRAQFDWSLRQDDRVTLHERTNVTQLPELGYESAIDLAVCDVSFTSIANIIDAVLACLTLSGSFCTLVKPQFEAPAALVGEGGIVTDPAVRVDALVAVIELFAAKGLFPVDVGRAQFDWSLRQDDRVTLHERTNVTQLPELGYESAIDLAVCDVSFTSIANIIDAVLACLTPMGSFCTLVKPQFEAPAALVGEGGIVTDPAVRVDTLVAVIELFAAKGLFPVDVCVSPIHGAKGNVEFFLYGTRFAPGERSNDELQAQVSALSEKAATL